jgi:hypothetical protein
MKRYSSMELAAYWRVHPYIHLALINMDYSEEKRTEILINILLEIIRAENLGYNCSDTVQQITERENSENPPRE